MEIELFTVFHKNNPIPQYPYIKPIQVGMYGSNTILPMISDASMENIAEKNILYCELTALYWIWKNKFDSKYLGLCHYRRFFDYTPGANRYGFQGRQVTDFNINDFSQDHGGRLLELISTNDWILPKPLLLRSSVERHFCEMHSKLEWMLMKNLVLEIYPEYSKSMISFFGKSNRLYSYNMFITNTGCLQDYCNWLFPILSRLEILIELKLERSPSPRIMGFLGERLLTLYIRHLR